MHSKAIALWVIVAAALAGAAIAADGAPPLPRAASGADVTVLARGIPLPAGIAIGKGTVFVAAFGSEDGKTPGGLFRLQGGQATKLADGMYIGLTWHGGTLYAGSLGRTGSQIVAFRGWDGKRFASRKVLRRSPVSFTGLAVGPDGRLYAGGATEDCDLCKQKHALSQTVMSMRLDGTDLRVVSRGLRQPFGIAFARGIPEPFVTVEGQENLGKKEPPDYVVRARAGDGLRLSPVYLGEALGLRRFREAVRAPAGTQLADRDRRDRATALPRDVQRHARAGRLAAPRLGRNLA